MRNYRPKMVNYRPYLDIQSLFNGAEMVSRTVSKTPRWVPEHREVRFALVSPTAFEQARGGALGAGGGRVGFAGGGLF